MTILSGDADYTLRLGTTPWFWVSASRRGQQWPVSGGGYRLRQRGAGLYRPRPHVLRLCCRAGADGRSEDDFAYLRSEREFRNYLINELPRGDFAYSQVRQLLVDQFNTAFLDRLVESRMRRWQRLQPRG